MIQPIPGIKTEEKPEMEAIDLTDEEPFDVELPDGWLHPFTQPALNQTPSQPMIQPIPVIKPEEEPEIEVIDLTDEEPFDVKLPDGWLHPFTQPALNQTEQMISLDFAPEMLQTISNGMSNYPYDPMNTLQPLFAFRSGYLPSSLFNWVYYRCTRRSGESISAECKRVMYIINLMWAHTHSKMERNTQVKKEEPKE